MYHDIVFQTLAQSNKEIESYRSTKAGYWNGVLIMVRVNEF